MKNATEKATLTQIKKIDTFSYGVAADLFLFVRVIDPS